MRTYEQTHPWLTFQLDLSRAPWQLWLLAGEAISKCEHLSGVALGPDAATELMKVYLAKGAHATTAIEGNTLTEAEARKRIDGIKDLPPSKAYLGVEIDNIIKSSNEILRLCRSNEVPELRPELINKFNSEVLDGLSLDPEIRAGEIRTYSVGVADYRGAPAQDCEELLERLCTWLRKPWIEKMDGYSEPDCRRLDAVLKAVVAHLYLAWIHPFGDGNGRTARLLEFFILATSGVPFPAAHLLSNHYNETRSDYYRQLSLASKSGGDVMPFMLYALRGFVDQLREQLRLVREEQLNLFWRHHVHLTLGDSETGKRRRYLVEDLSLRMDGVPKSKLIELSVRVLRYYVTKGDKTLQRDLSELERLKLVRREGDLYFANRDLVLAYMPPAHRNQVNLKS
jgi:Fic family protein